ncbi:MAG TPA: hypothetical protein VM618_07815 [Acidimicrobiia bacterium]|nr:hypothetical protein [Acidimicrobiia bacterium]
MRRLLPTRVLTVAALAGLFFGAGVGDASATLGSVSVQAVERTSSSR